MKIMCHKIDRMPCMAGNTAVLYVLTEGVAKDLALYRCLVDVRDYVHEKERCLDYVATCGEKMTYAKASQVFPSLLESDYRL